MERHHLGVTRNALRENRLVIFGLCSIGLRRHGPFISCHIFLPLCFALSGTHLGSSFFCLPPPGVSSRWEGKRVIDYGVSNCPFKHEHLDMMPEKWSDHRLCRMSIISPEMNDANEQFEVVPTNWYQSQCSETFGDWTEQLLRGWAETKEKWENLCFQCEQQVNQLCAGHFQVSKQKVANEIWNQVSLFLESFLAKRGSSGRGSRHPDALPQKTSAEKRHVPENQKFFFAARCLRATKVAGGALQSAE